MAPDIVRQMELYKDPALDRLIRKHWPATAKLSSQEKIAEMQRIKGVIGAGTGDVGGIRTIGAGSA